MGRTIKVQRGPCTPETEHCRDLRSYAKDMPECCKEHLRHVVFTFGDAMTAAGITWWLDYGSLLGSYRNPLLKACKAAKEPWVCPHPDCPPAPRPPGIIPHDKDADFGFFGADWERVLAVGGGEWTEGRLNNTKAALGLHLVHKPMYGDPKKKSDEYQGGDSLKVQLSAKNVIHFDGFAWYDGPLSGPADGRMHRHRYLGCDKRKGRSLPVEWLLPLSTIEWEGRMLPCPARPDLVVAHRYPNWREVERKNNWGRAVA